MTTYEGKLIGSNLRIACVVARFNELITTKLLEGAKDTLIRHDVDENSIHTAWVPGSFELGLTAKKLAETRNYDAIICLGAVIRGETTHYDHVCAASTASINEASMSTGLPVIFGVITTENLEQAMARAGSKSGNKGSDAALAAIEMANLLKSIEQ